MRNIIKAYVVLVAQPNGTIYPYLRTTALKKLRARKLYEYWANKAKKENKDIDKYVDTKSVVIVIKNLKEGSQNENQTILYTNEK